MKTRWLVPHRVSHMELWRGDTGELYLDHYVRAANGGWTSGGMRHAVSFEQMREGLAEDLQSHPLWHLNVVDRGLRMDSNPTEEDGAPTLTPEQVLRQVEIYERLL